MSKPSIVPSGFFDYAKYEGIRDYEWRYLESLANARFMTPEKRIENAGINWQGTFSFERIENIMKSYSSDASSSVVLSISAKEEGRAYKWWSRIFSHLKNEVDSCILLIKGNSYTIVASR